MLPDKDALTLRYAKLSNDQLLEILYQKEDYTPEALEVVQAEINKRQIAQEEVSDFTTGKEVEKVFAAHLALIPLAWWEKLFFFFGWFVPGFLAGAFRMNYAEDGLEMKVRQSRFFRIAGFISLLAAGFLSAWLELEVMSFVILGILFGVTFWIAPGPPPSEEA